MLIKNEDRTCVDRPRRLYALSAAAAGPDAQARYARLTAAAAKPANTKPPPAARPAPPKPQQPAAAKPGSQKLVNHEKQLQDKKAVGQEQKTEEVKDYNYELADGRVF